MYPVRYIHAADLHLDAAFKGISFADSSEKNSALSARLHQATFTALERLIDLCTAEKPDFLVIAGDIYNHEDRSIKAQLGLRDACKSLERCGIQVFLAHGNHDPLSSRLQTLRWPDNVVIFGPSVESHAVWREGQVVAIVHGVSHSADKESRNLAQAFARRLPRQMDQDNGCFQLGLLHCSLDSSPQADRYAPCSLDDLKNTRLDAWALGHIHQRAVLCDQPFIAYAGNSQGLHINEGGPRGCLLVQATPLSPARRDKGQNVSVVDSGDVSVVDSGDVRVVDSGDGHFLCQAFFHPLGPVQWESLDVNLEEGEGVKSLDLLESTLLRSLEGAAARTGVGCQSLIARLRVQGRSPLDKDLRSPAVVQDLVDRLRAASSGTPEIWLKDLLVDTGQELDMAALASREDLLGEILRLSSLPPGKEPLPAPLHSLLESALRPLFEHSKARHALQALDEDHYAALLKDAQRLCIDLMEAR